MSDYQRAKAIVHAWNEFLEAIDTFRSVLVDPKAPQGLLKRVAERVEMLDKTLREVQFENSVFVAQALLRVSEK